MTTTTTHTIRWSGHDWTLRHDNCAPAVRSTARAAACPVERALRARWPCVPGRERSYPPHPPGVYDVELCEHGRPKLTPVSKAVQL